MSQPSIPQRIYKILHNFKLRLIQAINVFVIHKCAGCGSRCTKSICQLCALQLKAPNPQYAQTEITNALGYLPFVYAIDYTPQVAKLIHALKELGRIDLASVFARYMHAALILLAQKIPKDQSFDLLLVPIPSSTGATLRRGYSPVELILQTTVPSAMVVRGLSYARAVKDQTHLNQKQRVTNMHKAMVANHILHKRKCILVDDVITTGASISEGIRALAESGAEVVGIVCLARV